MDLRTVKEIAALKAQVGPLQRQAAERLNAAVDQAKTAAIDQFKSHFTKAGFTLTGESRRYAATYEGMQFILEIADTPGPGTFFKFSLNPPAALGEAKVAVQMVRKNPSAIEPPMVTGNISRIDVAEKDLADARAALSSSAPAFCYVVVAEESADADATDAQAHEVSTPVFETLGDFLEAVYPH
jgi:hypothetical protein